MIKSFQHRGLQRLFEKDDSRKFPPEMVDKIRTVLFRLDTAETIGDMDLQSFKLHELKGDRHGTWSVTVRANWRMTFRFDNGDAFDVDFEDYH